MMTDFYAGNQEGLESVLESSNAAFKQTKIMKFRHLFIMTDLFLNRLRQKPLSQIHKLKAQELIKYFANLQLWTHYDTGLFNNTMFALPQDARVTLSHSAVKNFRDYKNYSNSSSEILLFINNIIILSISSDHLEDIPELIADMHKIEQQDDWGLERIILMFHDGVADYLQISGHPQAKCHQAIDLTGQLGLTKWQFQFQDILKNLILKVEG